MLPHHKLRKKSFSKGTDYYSSTGIVLWQLFNLLFIKSAQTMASCFYNSFFCYSERAYSQPVFAG